MRRFLIAIMLLSLGACLSQAAAAQAPGTLKWDFHSAMGFWGSSPALGKDGTIYIVSGDGLYAINPDGKTKWLCPQCDNDLSSPTVGPDGTIYAEDTSGVLYAVNPQNGIPKWSFKILTKYFAYSCPPGIGPDGTIYAACGSELCALKPDGSLKWRYSLEVMPAASLAIAPDGTIYVTNGGVSSALNELDAIKPDGQLKWKFPQGIAILCSPALDADGTIYVTGYISGKSNYLFAISPEGILDWNINLSAEGIVEPSIAPVIGANGTIYVRMIGTANDTKVVAVSPPGIKLWSCPLGCNVYPFPAANTMAVGANGLIYVGSACGKLYAIRPGGTQEWALSLTSQSLAVSAPVIASDGTLYIAAYSTNTNGSSMDAVYTSSMGLAPSPWPMLQRDARHTGCASSVIQRSPVMGILNLFFDK
jgi:outer membrane protein assembly factor BamB